MISEEEHNELHATIKRVLGDAILRAQVSATITFKNVAGGLTLAIECVRKSSGDLGLWVYNPLTGKDGTPSRLVLKISYVRSSDPGVLETQGMRVLELVEYLDGPDVRNETDYSVGEFKVIETIVNSILEHHPILTKEPQL